MSEDGDSRKRHLWAPWRMAYIAAAKEAAAKVPQAGEDCFLCRGFAATADRTNLIVQRGRCSATVLNRYPYNNGHLLVAPLAHKANLQDLTDEEHLELQATLTRMTRALDALMAPHGYNIGLNLGKAAGAGLPGHLHWHVVPRWNGDTNFMPVLGEVKVIVQSLEACYDLLLEELQRSE